MATLYNLDVLTPQGKFFSDETTQIVTRTSAGDIGVLANHYYLVANLVPGPLKILQEDGSWRVAAISTGILKVGGNRVTVIANSAEWTDDIDVKRAELAKENAMKRIEQYKGKDRLEWDLAELKLQRALNRIRVKSGFGK